MARIALDTYRGWEISFDIDNEKFFVQSDEWDQESERGSFAACKKWIDEFLKANTEFKPMRIEKFSYSEFGEVMTVVGIRKDGHFIVENSKGERKQLSDYHLGDYILVDQRNDAVKVRLSDIAAKIDDLREMQQATYEELHRVTMAEYKQKLGIK